MPTAFFDPAYLSLTPLTGINPIHYFLHPFNPLVPPFLRLKKSVNETLMDSGIDDWNEMKALMIKQPGYQYVLSSPSGTTTLFTITLLERYNPHPKKNYRILASWYIDHGVIYTCPRAEDVEGVMLGKRVRSLEVIREVLEGRYEDGRGECKKKKRKENLIEEKVVERVWGRCLERIHKEKEEEEKEGRNEKEDDKDDEQK